MPAAKTISKQEKDSSSPANSQIPSSGVRFDIIFGGPLLFVPQVVKGSVTAVDVFAPENGHPVGAVFLPGIFFTDAELNDPGCANWPEAATFTLLDPHSYSVELTQKRRQPRFPVTSIPENNHKIPSRRKLRADWHLTIAVHGNLSQWASLRNFDVRENHYLGSDAPKTASVAGMHRLTYPSVAQAELCGFGEAQKLFLNANLAQGGSLIILGEIPYRSTLRHERHAIESLANLAGLDLHLVTTTPSAMKGQLMNHIQPCGHSIILT